MGLSWTLRDRMPKQGERDGPYYFDAHAADAIVGWWNRHIRIPDGPKYGHRYVLPEWQERNLRALYGWRQKGGGRRYSRFAQAVARGNTKSSWGGGVGLLGLAGEHRPTARVIGAGHDKKNAGEIYTYASRMVLLDPSLKRHLRNLPGTKRILRRNLTGSYEILASDPSGAHGSHATTLLIDDLQAHKRPEFVKVLRSGQTQMGDDKQMVSNPLELDFMTAGSNRRGIGFEEWQFWLQALEDPSLAPDLLVDMHFADPTDDIEDPKVWLKANPNLGISVDEGFIRKRVHEAKTRPSELNDVLRYQFNIWTDAEVAKYTIAQWKSCAGGLLDEAKLVGRPCHTAVDLSSSRDLTAIAHYFPPMDGAKAQLLVRHIIPRANIEERVQRDKISYDVWVREGWIRTTPGNVIDETAVGDMLLVDLARFKPRELAYDRWGMDGIIQRVQKEMPNLALTPFGQGFQSMGPAMKAFDRLIYGRGVEHHGDKVLAWQAGNLVVETDPAGNEKPTKRSSRERIDGMVASIMAVGACALMTDVESANLPAAAERSELPMAAGMRTRVF